MGIDSGVVGEGFSMRCSFLWSRFHMLLLGLWERGVRGLLFTPDSSLFCFVVDFEVRDGYLGEGGYGLFWLFLFCFLEKLTWINCF